MNSSSGAVPAKKDTTRKNSVMLPGSSSGMMDPSGKTTGSSLAAAGSSVIGGIDNYKRYQMLVAQSVNMGPADGSNKRSQSLLLDSKKYPIKRTVTMNDNNTRRKTSKLS